MKIIVFSPTSTNLKLEGDQPLGGADSVLWIDWNPCWTSWSWKHISQLKKRSKGNIEVRVVFHSWNCLTEKKSVILLFITEKVFPIPNTIKYKNLFSILKIPSILHASKDWREKEMLLISMIKFGCYHNLINKTWKKLLIFLTRSFW